MTGRLLFDVSTSIRWSGPPVGIVRVERELAKWAAENTANCHFIIFDGSARCYREVSYKGLQAMLAGIVALDTTGMKNPSNARVRASDRVPGFLRSPYFWVTKFRRMALRTLGELILTVDSERIGTLARRLMRMIAGRKYSKVLGWSSNPDRVFARPGFFASKKISFEAGDRIFFCGANWTHSDLDCVVQYRKHCNDLTLIVLCYDIIPLTSPHFYKPHDVDAFRRYYQLAFEISSLVLVTSKIVGNDIRHYCEKQGIPIPLIKLIPLGFDLPRQDHNARAATEWDRPYSRYILLVSTIEPRKGHRMIQSVWDRLLRDGIPQRLDATLVLVGRPGWLVDDLLEKLSTAERIVILDQVDDQRLAELYDGADFCIYPSEYEGYGLPIVEALCRQKPVIASNVGVVPELESQRLKRLTPDDEDAWYLAIREWLLESPDHQGTAEFRHPTWQEAASTVLTAINARSAIERCGPKSSQATSV